MTHNRHTMPVGKVAEILGCTPGHVHDFDTELEPQRDRHGRRWYLPSTVEAFASKRAAAKAGAR